MHTTSATLDPTCVNTVGGYPGRQAVPVPPAIPERPREREYPEAYQSYGAVLDEGVALSDAQKRDGIYLFVVARHQGREIVAWALRAPGESPTEPGKSLATHPALVNQIARTLGIAPADVSVHGAGQVQILNGEVSRFDNRAGTRRGNRAHLDYSEHVLWGRGLPIAEAGEARTAERNDYATDDREIFHADAAKLARDRAAIERSPKHRAMRDKLLELHAGIYRDHPEFRHPTIPGYLDVGRLFDYKLFDPDFTFGNDTFDAAGYGALFKSIQVDGPELGTNNLVKQPASPARVEALVNLVLLGHMRRALSE